MTFFFALPSLLFPQDDSLLKAPPKKDPPERSVGINEVAFRQLEENQQHKWIQLMQREEIQLAELGGRIEVLAEEHLCVGKIQRPQKILMVRPIVSTTRATGRSLCPRKGSVHIALLKFLILLLRFALR